MSQPDVDDLMVNEPDYVGTFTRNEAEGAYPNGTRVCKINSEKGDTFSDGEPGVVLGSLGPLEMPEITKETFYFYFVEWDSKPRVACGIASLRLGKAQ